MSQFYWISLFCSKYFVHDCRMAKFHAPLPLNGYRTRFFLIDNQRKQPLHYVQLVMVEVSVRLTIQISLGAKLQLKLTTNFQLNTNLFSPGTKFQLKLTIVIFWTKFTRKGYLRSKTEKTEQHHWIVHIWIRLATEFHFKLRTLTFWTKFAKNGIFGQKLKKWVPPLNSAYSNWTSYQISESPPKEKKSSMKNF